MFGSLDNKLFHESFQPEPHVGIGCTVLSWTDRYAATVVGVTVGADGLVSAVTVVEDVCTRIDANGMSSRQEWDCVPDPDGRQRVFTRRANGTWVRRGDPTSDGLGLVVGVRDHFYDYGF